MLEAGSNRFVPALTVLGAAIGMGGGFAVLISGTFGIFMKPISLSLEWTRSQVSLLPTMALMGYAVGSPMIGRFYDRFGIRPVLLAAVIVFSLGIASLAMLPNSLPLYAGVMLVIGLASAATAPSGYILILAKTFLVRLGLVIGLAMIGLGLGIVAAPAVAQLLISTLGWRLAYSILALVALVCGLTALAFGVGRGARSPGVPDQTIAESISIADGMTLKEALRDWRFWLLASSCVAIGVVGFGTQAHLAAALSDGGVASADVVQVAGLFGGGILAGRITAALLMDRFFAPAIAMIYCSLGGVGLLLLARLSPNETTLLNLSALAAGLLTGSEGDTMPFLTRHYFGLRSFGSIYGCVIGLAGIGALLGPIAYGVSFDLTGSYIWILNVAAIASIISGASLLLLGRYRYCRRVATKEDVVHA